MFYPLSIIPVSVQFLQRTFKETLNMGGFCLTKNSGTFGAFADGSETSLAIFRKIQKLLKCPKILFPGQKLNGKTIFDKTFSGIWDSSGSCPFPEILVRAVAFDTEHFRNANRTFCSNRRRQYC